MVLSIRILTPFRVICSTKADEAILPSETGVVGVLEGHATLVTNLDEAGLMRMRVDGKWIPIILFGGGLAEIDRDRVTVLVTEVEELTYVDRQEAEKEVEKMTLIVQNAETSKERLDATLDLKLAKARLEAADYLTKSE